MKVLVVDDDATNRLVLKGLLEKEDHDVMLAVNGVEAIQQYENGSPDLILMDVMMPEMDGYEATREIKKRCGSRFVPIIFLTAVSGNEALVTCLEYGGDDYIGKPFNRTVLSAKIEAMNRIVSLYYQVQNQKEELEIHKRHVQRETEVAEKIFNSILERSDLNVDFIHTLRRSAEAFNGDIVLATRNPNGGMNILVGDFTGHGLAAAIGAMPVADVFYGMSKKGFELEDIVSEINKKLRIVLPMGRFLAACIMHIDTRCEYLKIWNGGMPEVLIYRPRVKQVVEYLPSEHVPLGISSPVQFETQATRVKISPGDYLYIYSDGVIETTNEHDELFGMDRLVEVITTFDGKGIISELESSLSQFSNSLPQADDITLMEFHCSPTHLLQLDNEISIGKTYATSWSMSFIFETDTLQRLDPVTFLMKTLNEMQGLRNHSESLFMIISELFSNALEHGVLGLDSKLKTTPEGFAEYYFLRETLIKKMKYAYIKFSFSQKTIGRGGEITIGVEDSGDGFDYTSLDVEKQSMPHESVKSGRGQVLIADLCETITYKGKGNVVEAVYSWNETPLISH